MANKSIFRSWLGKLIPATDTVNEERAPAYAMSPKQALAQYAATGCLNATFYASAEAQLGAVTKLCETLEPEFIARTALYCRERGFMKDMPALLCAVLATRAPALLGRIFDRAIDDGKMVRNFVQIMRSGALGRKSLGSAPKRLVECWLASRDDETVFRASVGRSPSLADVIRMVHPRPATPARSALYGYLLGRSYDPAALPELVRRFEAWKATKEGEAPEVPFQMLTALDLGAPELSTIARRGGWHMTRMNLNTFLRHGVFAEAGMPERIAARLRDPEAIGRARVFPYQLLAAYRSADAGLGIIPGSMGTRSYIVRGRGSAESFHSCSHGAGRAMSRAAAKRRFTLEDHAAATKGIECRKDADVIDETPGAYKPIDAVMHAQRDLVEVVHTLRQVVCVKG